MQKLIFSGIFGILGPANTPLMKKHKQLQKLNLLSFLAICVLSIINMPANAQARELNKQSTDTAKKEWIIKTDPFYPSISIALGPNASKVFDVTVERYINPHLSLQFTTLFNLNSAPTYEPSGENFDNRYILAPQLKYYFCRTGKHRGLFVGAYTEYELLEYGWYNANQSYTYYTNCVGGGIMMGVQYYVFKRMSVEALFGTGFERLFNSYPPFYVTLSNSIYADPYLLDINIGYTF